MKKYLATVFTLIISLGFVFGTPQANAAPIVETKNVEIQSASATITTNAYFSSYQGATKFYTLNRNGVLYRGYLTYQGYSQSRYIYSGTLYRSDLPYPIL
ncbi:hypothetical protein [Jeotgalibacillus aurantiacus]|uniref:hypothetical protein n=1 Tax=Jeotgalibacillus aurantiacus TaxID=2763266 RepID=UPI001D0AD475|nr:hypothetical protein [Jeotgalibacillus aurantiacus]